MLNNEIGLIEDLLQILARMPDGRCVEFSDPNEANSASVRAYYCSGRWILVSVFAWGREGLAQAHSDLHKAVQDAFSRAAQFLYDTLEPKLVPASSCTPSVIKVHRICWSIATTQAAAVTECVEKACV